MHLRRHLALLALYAGLTVLAIYQPLFNAATHVGGSWTTDYYHFHWNYWWVRHALTTPSLNVFETNFVLFPYTTNLAYHTLTLFWYPLWALVEPLTGTLIAFSIIFVVAMTLTGYFTYVLLVEEGVPGGFAIAGGALLQLTPAMLLGVMLSTINYLALFWYPLNLLIWRRVALHSAQPRAALLWSVIQGSAFYAMLLTDYQYAIYLALLIVPYGLLTLAQQPGWRARGRLVLWGVLALFIMLALLWFAGPLRYILAFDTSQLSPMPMEDAQAIPFPQGYFARLNVYDRVVTLGGVVLPLLLVTLAASLLVARRGRRDRRRWFWALLVLPPLLLSAGGYISVAGVQIPTPYVLLHEVFGGLFRSPARFGAVLIIPAAIFIGRTWKLLLPAATPARHAGTLLVIGFVFGEALLYPQMPIQPVTPHYDFYATIGQEQGDPYDEFVVLEVPVAGGSGEAWVGEFRPMETQFYGITHGKRMLNGSIARAPLNHFWYWLYDDPMLAWLGQRRYLEPERVLALLTQRIDQWPIGYIVIHQDFIGREKPTNQEIIGWFNTLPDLLCPVWVERDAVVYRTRQHPDGCPPRTPPETASGEYLIDLGVPGDEFFIGWGWHWQEQVPGTLVRWAGQYPQAQLYVDLPDGGYTLSFMAQAFYRDRSLRVLVNDAEIGQVLVSAEGFREFNFELPAALLSSGQHTVFTLVYDSVDVPANLGMGTDTRSLAIMVDWVRFQRR